MEVRVVADEDTNILFRLMGFKTILIDNPQRDDFEKKFDHILEDEHIGVIIMSDKYLMKHKKYFRKIKIPFLSIDEQQKLAKILSSIDTNIEQKQTKLTQSKNLKKSLMADLLTGRVRVKP